MQNSDEMDFEEFKRRYQEVPVEEYPNNVLEAVPEPMVSVHISTYQHADFIRDCIDGVLMQETDFPVEIIIGEDESDDGTREICKEYAERYPDTIRLFLHRRENNISIHGQPTGRFQFVYSNFMARGKYIAICEGDDYWTDPKKLQKQVDFLEENKEYSYCYHPFQKLIMRDGKKNELTASTQEKWSATSTLLYKNLFDTYPNLIFRILHADTLLKRRLELTGHSERLKKIKPSVYRVHKDGIYGGKNPLEKDFEVLRSNTIMLEYFRDTEHTNQILETVKKYFGKSFKRSLIVRRWNYTLGSLRVLVEAKVFWKTFLAFMYEELAKYTK